jgi:hypothetical protein
MATPSLFTFDSFLRGQTHGFPGDGDPNWYVKAPVGTLFGRHEWGLWIKLPGQPWVKTIYEILDPMAIDQVDVGATWIKTTNELRMDGWRFLGLDPFGNEAAGGGVIPTGSMSPILQLLYALNDAAVTGSVDFGVINEGSFSDIQFKIFNSGSAPLELTSSLITSGTGSYSITVVPNSSSIATGSFTLFTIRAEATASGPAPFTGSSLALSINYSSYPNSSSFDYGSVPIMTPFPTAFVYTNETGQDLLITGAAVVGPFYIVDVLLNGNPESFPLTMSGVMFDILQLNVVADRQFVEVNYGSINLYHGGPDSPYRTRLTASFDFIPG